MNMKIKRLTTKRMAVLSVVLAVLVLAMAGTTLAVLMHNSDNVKNVFNPSEVTCEVYEDFSDGQTEKKDVMIRNTGDVDAYIRAAIIVNWIDKDGNIAPVSVKEGDYILKEPENSKWIKHSDGYYYYPERITPDGYTGELIKSIAPVKRKAPDGYTLSVEIIADAIQADGVNDEGVKAVVDAWGVDPEDLQQ